MTKAPHFLCPLVRLTLTLTLALAARADEPPIAAAAPPAHLTNLVRASDGALWGLVTKSFQDNGPYRLENDRWQRVPVTGLPDRARPLCQTRRADGAVVTLWESGDEDRIFTVQQGGESKAEAVLHLPGARAGAEENQHLFADSKNNVWYTANGPEICRLTPEGRAECLHVVSPDECAGRGRPGRGRRGTWNTIVAFEDAQGAMWFRTDGATYNDASIRGLLVYDGEKFTLRDLALPESAPLPRIGALAQKNPGHLWVTTTAEGLCSFDVATATRRGLSDAPPDLRWTRAIFPRGEEWLFLCASDAPGHADALWRLRSERWDKLIDGVDANPAASRRADRLWTRAATGNFLGAVGSGLWFVPDKGPPVALDWRRGFPLATPYDFVPLPDGKRWLGTDADGRSWIGDPDRLLDQPAPEADPRLRVEPARQAFVADHRRHLWGGFPENPRLLREWDGARWIEHEVPADIAPPEGYRTLLGVDGLGRIWARGEWGGGKQRMFIYDPAGDRWQSFDEFEGALVAQAPLGRAAEPPMQANIYNLARYGPGGQACYLTRQMQVAWFDGTAWHRWTRDDIGGKKVGVYPDGPPFFTDDGRLRVNMKRRTYEYAADGGWRGLDTYEPGYADHDVRTARDQRPATPPGAPTRQPDSAAVDPDGVYWCTWQGDLYRCRDGWGVPVFKPDERQPFVDRRRLASVLLDARGSAFLRTDERLEYVVLAPPAPPPRTTLALTPPEPGAPADRVEVRLASDAAPLEGKVRFVWRLDGGAWQPAAADASPASVVLAGLPGGPHRFEARSLDAYLQTDAAPAVLDFEVRVDPAAQVAGYIAQLRDPDYDRRKAAVRALARQPDLALPALHAARACTDDADARWWIDAALGQVTGKP